MTLFFMQLSECVLQKIMSKSIAVHKNQIAIFSITNKFIAQDEFASTSKSERRHNLRLYIHIHREEHRKQ